MTARATSASSSPPTTAVSYLQALFDYLRLKGVDAAALQKDGALDLADRDARVTELEAAQLFNRASALVGDPDLGLHVAEHIRPGHYGVLGYVAMACGTLGEALQCQQRYQGLVLSIAPMEMRTVGGKVTLSWSPDTDSRYRQLAEFNLAAMLTFVRWITGRTLVPLGVDFAYAAPERLDEHRRVFGCPIRFQQGCYRLIVPFAWQALPLIQPDPVMRQLMDRLARQQMLSLAQADDPLVRARGLIARSLSDGEVPLARVAEQLHVSPRTFQRKLQERGESFTQLVDGVRREMAERYLADPALDLTDIAFLLGYSEQSAFTRAYKRWTGGAPQAARKGRSNS
jgi:AraC-like DNA-binding protein